MSHNHDGKCGCPCQKLASPGFLGLIALAALASSGRSNSVENSSLDITNSLSPSIPLPNFSKGTLSSTMYGDSVKCEVYCRKVTDNKARLLILYTGMYKNGQKLCVIIERKNNVWEGTSRYGQKMVITPEILQGEDITGKYVSHLPSDRGKFNLSKVETDIDFPIFENTVTQDCIIF